MTQYIKAPHEIIYRALIDSDSIAIWKVPTGMTCHVHAFDARVGGRFRVSLTYDAPTGVGKKRPPYDIYHGRFVELVPNKRVVELDEFETEDPAVRGELKITIELAEKDGGTEVIGAHEGLPPGVSAADNELGWRMALEKLASFITPSAWPRTPGAGSSLRAADAGQDTAGHALRGRRLRCEPGFLRRFTSPAVCSAISTHV